VEAGATRSPPHALAEDTFYKSFSEKQLTSYGSGRRSRIERHRLALLQRYAAPPGAMFEIGPGHGTLGELAVAAGWHYTAVETSPFLIEVLRKKGLNVLESWTPPFPMADASADVVYADQILEHMRGIDDARQFTAEALRSLKPGGHFFVVVPNYLKELGFFWDVDYTHNFVTTPRRMKQLLYDGGFEVLHMERAIGTSTGLARDVLSAAKVLVNVPGVDTLSRYTGTEELIFKIRKNLFETLTFVAKKPA
jgi:SAM-dependent methyltransferase